MKIKLWFAALIAGALVLLEQVAKQAFRYAGNQGLLLCANLYSQYTYDAALLLKAAALVAATADGSLVLDVGTGLLSAHLVIDVTALEVDSNDESYEIIVQGSNTAAFATAADIYPLTSITIGDKAATRLASGVLALGTDDAVGRYVLPVRNERNGTTFRYLRLKTIVAGTIATGINYSAFLAKD